MLEVAASLAAGACIAAGVVIGFGVPLPHPRLPSVVARWTAARQKQAREAGWPWLDGPKTVAAEVACGAAVAATAVLVTGLLVVSIPGFAGGMYAVREVLAHRARVRQATRQDAVLEAVRMMRQLLETGATSVNQAVSALADHGPIALRGEFRTISSRSIGRRQAWRQARDRIGEPLFDLLAAAVLIQRPGGGELAPLFADLEASVSAAQEVEREARALQAQARSASTIIVALPVAFLLILSALRSPYLEAFHTVTGQVFLVAMFAAMACGHAWMRRLLDLPGLQRLRLSDA